MAPGKKTKKGKQPKGGPKLGPPPSKPAHLRRINEKDLPKVAMEPLPAQCCMHCGCDRPDEEMPAEALRVMDVSINFE